MAALVSHAHLSVSVGLPPWLRTREENVWKCGILLDALSSAHFLSSLYAVSFTLLRKHTHTHMHAVSLTHMQAPVSFSAVVFVHVFFFMHLTQNRSSRMVLFADGGKTVMIQNCHGDIYRGKVFALFHKDIRRINSNWKRDKYYIAQCFMCNFLSSKVWRLRYNISSAEGPSWK